MRGRNEPAENMFGWVRAMMSRPVGVRAESETELAMRPAATQALEGNILEIFVMVFVIIWAVEVKVDLAFQREAFGHWRDGF